MSVLKVPFAIETSHHKNTQEFGSTSSITLETPCVATDVVVSGVHCSKFQISSAANGTYLLQVESADLTRACVGPFMDRLEVALTVHFGLRERNAHYGTPFVRLDRFNSDFTDSHSSGIAIGEKVHIGLTSPKRLGHAELEGLRDNSLLRLYADGLRANGPNAKYFHWFIIIEEFLEKSAKLNEQFKPLLSPQELAVLQAATVSFGEQKQSAVMAIASRTEESRHQKLAAILNLLGIGAVGADKQRVEITPNLCRGLIDERHKLFHRGKSVDEGKLYFALFPIVTKLAERSEELIAYRDENSAGQSN